MNVMSTPNERHTPEVGGDVFDRILYRGAGGAGLVAGWRLEGRSWPG
jgi:hypothetical protein